MKKLFAASSLMYAVPMVAFGAGALDTISDMVNTLGTIVGALIPIMVGIALVTFFWGLIRFVFSKGSDKAQDAKKYMIWSIVALFLMLSIYGIISVINQTVGINNSNGQLKAPTVDGL